MLRTVCDTCGEDLPRPIRSGLTARVECADCRRAAVMARDQILRRVADLQTIGGRRIA